MKKIVAVLGFCFLMIMPALEPAGGQKMVGKAPGPVEPGVKGAVQITLPDGATIQAKF